MQIDPINIRSGELAPSAESRSAPKPATSGPDTASFSNSDSVNVALQNLPDVRQAKVEKAIALIGRVSWPPPVAIQQISALLASQWSD